MAQTIKKTTKYKVSKSRGNNRHCPVCGKFMKKNNVKARVYKWWNGLYKIKDTFYWNAKKNNAISYGWIYNNKDGSNRVL